VKYGRYFLVDDGTVEDMMQETQLDLLDPLGDWLD
jgi:hypothetical protein